MPGEHECLDAEKLWMRVGSAETLGRKCVSADIPVLSG